MGEFSFRHRVRQLRYEVRVAFGLIAVQVVACQSPSSPNRCVNGVDGDGRGPMRSLDLTCLNRGSDIQCQSVIQESGYCAGGPHEITAVARWISTDRSVGVFTMPGHFQILALGATVIYSESDTLYSRQAFSYRVDPAVTPQQIGVVDVSVWQTTTGEFLPLAMVEFTPETGASQTCEQGPGSPYTPCRFWSDLSPAVVRASKAGYTVAQQSVTPKSTNLSFPTGIVLRLTPLQ
jgi:hypothetical protein